MSEPERVHKVLARIGVASRRAAEDLIREGRVKVDGEVVVIGDKISDEQELSLDGVVLSVEVDRVTYVLNKPKNVMSTAADPQGRPTVVELIGADTRIYPVGRLDFETEGLILLTNDGSLTHRLTHPSFGVPKTYLVELDRNPTPKELSQLRKGIELEDGITAPAKASCPSAKMLQLVIGEGRNRQVRRMCAALDLEVLRLVRTRIGSVSEPKLGPGEFRQLDQTDLLELQRSIETGKS